MPCGLVGVYQSLHIYLCPIHLLAHRTLFFCYGVYILCQHKLTLCSRVLLQKLTADYKIPYLLWIPVSSPHLLVPFHSQMNLIHTLIHSSILILSSNLHPHLESDLTSLVFQLNLHILSTFKPTNALYFLVMFINPTHVSAATEPSSGVQGHIHFNIHCYIWFHHLYTTMYVNFLLTVDNTHCFRLCITLSFKCLA